MKRLIIALLTIALLIHPVAVNSSVVEFSDTQIVLKFYPNEIISDTLIIETSNFPDTGDFDLVLRVDNVSYQSTNGMIEFPDNFITTTNTYELSLDNGTTTHLLFDQEISTGVWAHMIHVYSNWSSGQPPPSDNRGLGVGALLDAKLLNTTAQEVITTLDEGKTLAEVTLNLLLGDRTDYDQDSSVEFISDEFGFIQFTYGLRDHIFNAGNAPDAPDEVKAKSLDIQANLSSTVIDSGGYGTYLSNLNTSDSTLAKIYQSAFDLLTNDTVQGQETIRSTILDLINNDFWKIVINHYNEFRDLVYGADITLNLSLDLISDTDGSSKPTGESIDGNGFLAQHIGVILVGLSVIVLVTSSRKVIKE